MLSFLVVDDDAMVQRALRSMLRKYGDAGEARSAGQADQLLDRSWDGLLLDVCLGDGSGLDVLASARRRGVRAPAVVLTGALDHEIVNRTAKLDARLVSKPCGTPELASFLSDVLLFKTGDRVTAALERARHRWMLTEREASIVAGALRGRTRGDHLEDLGITENTYKTHVRRLLDKTDYTNLSSLAIDLLAER